ncbi:hypothetical protein [Wolbachia endosymbiont of Rhagoletis cerasi]|uniref:hypothetical protein n=1 Tax=Wolbachia endosymbiont of Rhagoletis cerasi TaxID=225363 RepID=UPI002022BAF4|nr:hypothetical protein [Wolbachia endosymbiont of Rhagoletis cerasi]
MEQSEVTFRDVISPFSFSPSSVTGSPVSISPSLSVTGLSIPLPFLHSSAIFYTTQSLLMIALHFNFRSCSQHYTLELYT